LLVAAGELRDPDASRLKPLHVQRLRAVILQRVGKPDRVPLGQNLVIHDEFVRDDRLKFKPPAIRRGIQESRAMWDFRLVPTLILRATATKRFEVQDFQFARGQLR
jgi:hypothetical protein